MVVFTKLIWEQCGITTVVVIRSEDSNVRLDRLELCVPMRVGIPQTMSLSEAAHRGSEHIERKEK